MQYPSPYSFRAISRAIINSELSKLDRLFKEMPDIRKALPALCMAINSGSPVKTETAEFAIDSFARRGIDINHDGGALLQASIKAENISLVALCLKSGANPNALFNEGFSLRSPLATAVSLGWNDDRRSRPGDINEDARPAAIIEMLLDKGADLFEKGIVCKAAAHRSPDTIKKLVERGGGVNDRNDKGKTPVFFCADSLPAVRYLISKGADVNARDEDGATPLMAMAQCFKSDIEAIRLLLKSGAEINAQDKFGWTALMFAASVGRRIVVEELIEHGAESSLKNNLQNAALALAEESALREAGVVELLKEAKGKGQRGLSVLAFKYDACSRGNQG